MLNFHHRGPAKVSIGIVTVTKGQTINATVALVVDCSIIKESTDAASLIDPLIIVCLMRAEENLPGQHGCQ